jgi:hypothetical protein
MATKGTLIVQDTVVAFTRVDQGDCISLTDIAKVKNASEPKDVVKNWLRSRSTIDFLGLWEKINNPQFKGVEFDSFKLEAGTNSFTLSPSKWIEATGAIGNRELPRGLPEITAQEMCKEMVANDLAQAKQHALLKANGYSVNVSVE